MDKSKLNFLYIGIFFILNIILYFIFKLLNEGSIINLYPQNKFNDEKYINLWKEFMERNNIISKIYIFRYIL